MSPGARKSSGHSYHLTAMGDFMDKDHAAESSHRRVREAFDAVFDRPESERLHALGQLGLHEQEHQLVLRLLEGHSKSRLFEVTALDWATQLEGDDYVDAMIGRRIGACELVRLVGRGGSSVVFLAHRRIGETTQNVALKLLNSGLTSAEAHRRFQREQAILSRLSHPNIARLIDAGIAEWGNPFIVMEFVEGNDIVSYATTRAIDLRTRIGLLIDICRAVNAAHRTLVVHRDLKPSNVLVTEDGVVKVLDFGIAKLVDDDRPETATQHIALTPAYAAPEQFTSRPAATSMDVYSLGVLASELILGGRLGPDATLPVGESAQTWQRWRRIDSDLSQILRAALASEPMRRYTSAGHMADDLARYLRREPLQIVPVSRWYRTRKFVSRHRTAVVAACLLCIAVIGGIVGITYQWRIAQQQAVLAREEATRAGAIRDFLLSLFDAGNAERPRDKQPSVEDIVADAGQRLLVENKLAAPLRADLLLTLADVASSIGSYDRSYKLLDEIERIAPTLGENIAEMDLQVRVRRGCNVLAQSTTDGAPILALLDPATSALESRTDETGLNGLLCRAKALQMTGRGAEASEAARRLVERYRNAAQPTWALSAMSTQVNIEVGVQHYTEAAKDAKTAVEFWTLHGSPQTPLALDLWNTIAIAREGVGDMSGAEEAYRTAIAIGDRIYAHPTFDHAQVIRLYGTFLIVQSRLDEAETQIRRALQMEQSIFGEGDPHTAHGMYAMARLYGARRDFPVAVQWLDKAIGFYREQGHSQMLARALAARGRFNAQAGQLREADRDLDQALEEQRAFSGDSTPAYAWILDVLADIQLRELRFEDALHTTDRVLAINAPVGGSMLQMTLSTRLKRAKALAGLERTHEALVELGDIEPTLARVAPKSDLRFDTASLEAIMLSKTSNTTEAREAAKRALELLSLAQAPDASLVGRLRALTGDIGHVH